MFQYRGEKEAYWHLHNTFSLQFHVGKKMEENVKTLTLFPMHEYSWLTCVINIRIGQAVFFFKKEGIHSHKNYFWKNTSWKYLG